MNEKDALIWKTVLITVIIVIIIFCILVYLGYFETINITVSSLANELYEDCKNSGPITYDYIVTPPPITGIYDYNLANALWQVGNVTSLSNCKDTIPLPPPFSNMLRIYGYDRCAGTEEFYAIIFWNQNLVCFAFTGTYNKEEWYDDLKFEQVPATRLSGSITGLPVSDKYNNPNTMVHKGFYAIYISIQKQLKAWWNENKAGKTNLFITGHSLGSSLSILAAFDFANGLNGTVGSIDNGISSNAVIQHYSIAGPRVGNQIFCETFDQRSPNSIRVFNVNDLVVALPVACLETDIYSHICINRGMVPFNKQLGSNSKNHIDAYNPMPQCFDNIAPC